MTEKQVRHLPPKQFKQIWGKILDLLNDPNPADAIMLKGYPYYRTDIGEFRIFYHFDKETVYLVLIGKRNDDEIYKYLKRKQ